MLTAVFCRLALTKNEVHSKLLASSMCQVRDVLVYVLYIYIHIVMILIITRVAGNN